MFKEIKIDEPIVMASGEEYDLLILAQYVSNDAIYVGLDRSKSRLDYPMDVTTNLEFMPLGTLLIDVNNLYLEDYKAFIKTLFEYGIVYETEPICYGHSGYVDYPMYHTGKVANKFVEELRKEEQ